MLQLSFLNWHKLFQQTVVLTVSAVKNNKEEEVFVKAEQGNRGNHDAIRRNSIRQKLSKANFA